MPVEIVACLLLLAFFIGVIAGAIVTVGLVNRAFDEYERDRGWK